MKRALAATVANLDWLSRPTQFDRRSKRRAASWRLSVAAAKASVVMLFLVACGGVLLMTALAVLPPSVFSAFDQAALERYWGRVLDAHATMRTADIGGDTGLARRAGLEFLRMAGEVHSGGDYVEDHYREVVTRLLDIADREDDLILMKAVAGKGVVFDPNDSFAWYYLGRALLRQGHLPEAESALRRAHAIRPFSPQITAHLARLYEAAGQMENAAAIRKRQAAATLFCLEAVKTLAKVEAFGNNRYRELIVPLNPCSATPLTFISEFDIDRLTVTLAPLTSAELRYTSLAVTPPEGSRREMEGIDALRHVHPIGPGLLRTDISSDAPIGASPGFEFEIRENPIATGSRLEFSMTLCPSAALRDKADMAAR